VIDEYASGESHEGIMDPYGGDLDAYRQTADALETELEKLFDRIKG
jgi:protein-tyrosine-phosphatase